MNRENWTPKPASQLSNDTKKVINRVFDHIPPLPVAVQRIIEMASDMDIGAKELAEVALTDPVLSSKIITLVNSAFYGMDRHIDDLRVAIVLIGFNSVRNIAIQSRFLHSITEGPDSGFVDKNTLWKHSFLVSVCSESFVRDENPRQIGILMTLGILHDIGKFALNNIEEQMQKKHMDGTKNRTLVQDGMQTLEREEYYFGVNHAIIGGMLAHKWHLSERICHVLEYHHYPSFFGPDTISSSHMDEIITICLSDMMVHRYYQDSVELPEPDNSYFEMLGLKPPLSNLMTPALISKLKEAEAFIQSMEESSKYNL